MNDVRDSLIDTIRQNPLPATLAGVGIGWLLMNRSRSASFAPVGGMRATEETGTIRLRWALASVNG
jgi:hypothetical protein